ncbi:MAG: hypothetical protein ACI8PZ_001847 [Myxococcota bacterium]|jgi:hypothetical protein
MYSKLALIAAMSLPYMSTQALAAPYDFPPTMAALADQPFEDLGGDTHTMTDVMVEVNGDTMRWAGRLDGSDWYRADFRELGGRMTIRLSGPGGGNLLSIEPRTASTGSYTDFTWGGASSSLMHSVNQVFVGQGDMQSFVEPWSQGLGLIAIDPSGNVTADVIAAGAVVETAILLEAVPRSLLGFHDVGDVGGTAAPEHAMGWDDVLILTIIGIVGSAVGGGIVYWFSECEPTHATCQIDGRDFEGAVSIACGNCETALCEVHYGNCSCRCE